MNMAQLWKLPVIYVCENNLYNQYTHQSETTAGSMTGRAQAFGIYAMEVDGQDVQQVYAAMSELAERARRGQGPGFLLCQTYRFYGHHVGDVNREYYRSKDEETHWRTNCDPLKLLADTLTTQKLVEAEVFEQIEQEVRSEVEAAVEYALNAAYPAPEEVTQHVYA